MSTHTLNIELIDAVQILVSTRDLCGDEREALRDWEADNRRLTDEERRIVRHHVEVEWAAHQRAAGVTKFINAAE